MVRILYKIKYCKWERNRKPSKTERHGSQINKIIKDINISDFLSFKVRVLLLLQMQFFSNIEAYSLV